MEILQECMLLLDPKITRRMWHVPAVLIQMLLGTIALADPRSDLEAARARWQSLGATDYVFSYRDQDADVISPRCGGALIRVRVAASKTIHPVVIRGSRRCPKGTQGRFIDVHVPESMDVLFERMRKWLDNRPTRVEIEANYDPTYGIPVRWSAVKPDLSDSDEGFTVSDFRVLR